MQRRCLSIYGTCVGVHLEIILGYKKEGAFNKGKKEKKKALGTKFYLPWSKPILTGWMITIYKTRLNLLEIFISNK